MPRGKSAEKNSNITKELKSREGKLDYALDDDVMCVCLPPNIFRVRALDFHFSSIALCAICIRKSFFVDFDSLTSQPCTSDFLAFPWRRGADRREK